MAFKIIVLTSIFFGATCGLRFDPMKNPDLYHGDISGVDLDYDRNAVVDKRLLWSGGKVYYTIDSSLSSLTTMILNGMRHIEKETCIRFHPHDGTQENYINLFYGDGCYSNWGKTGGKQPLSLGEACDYLGTVLHELLHALGFDHEQNRSDRDNYVIIYWENIEKGLDNQFRKLLPAQNWLITPFDYHSIMIYGEYSFSKDESSKTMISKSGVELLDPFYKDAITRSDVQRINILYDCHPQNK